MKSYFTGPQGPYGRERVKSLLSVLLRSFQTTDRSLKQHHNVHLEPASTHTESQLSVLLCLEDLPEILDGLHKQMTSTLVTAGSMGRPEE